MLDLSHPKYLIVLLLLGLVLGNKIKCWIEQERRITASGGHGRTLKSYIPFGFAFVKMAIENATRFRNLETWREMFAPYGPECHTLETRVGGPLGQRFIFTSDVRNVKAMLALQFEDYGKGMKFHENWEPFLGDGIFTSDGEGWRASRALIRTQFVRERVSDLGTIEKHVQVLINVIKGHGLGTEIDIFELFARFTLDAATDFLFGKSVNNLLTPNAEFSEAFDGIQRMLVITQRLGFLAKAYFRKKLIAYVKVIDDFVHPFVEEVLALSPEELDLKSRRESTFLHSLAAFTQDRKVLRDQLVSLLLAGRDTTASAMSFTFYELARHPEVVKKLREEIVSVVGLNRKPTYSDLKNMKYLQNTMQETLRLYPSVPFNVRIALTDTSLPVGGGPNGSSSVGILKGDIVIFSVLDFQRSEYLYPSSSSGPYSILNFNPDRWKTWQPKPWEYIPFSGGPRICPGQQFALAEMGYTLVRLLQEFDQVVSYMNYGEHERTGWNMKAEVVISPRDGVKIGFLKS